MCNATHFSQPSRLLSRIADAVGVDVESRTQLGDLLPEVFDIMIFDCLACTRSASCEA